jgi:WbqC-like protein family.
MNQIEDSRYLLSTTYFGPIQWYQKLCRYDCLIDGEERFIKQTYRNRCVIATTQGTQALTVPVEHIEVGRLKDELRSGASQEEGRWKKEDVNFTSSIETSHSPLGETLPPSKLFHQTSKDVLISDHGNWRHLHWNALKSAYGESPFFEYYADDIRPFFEKKWKYLWDFNWEIMEKMCELLQIDRLPLTIDHSKDTPANVQCSMVDVQSLKDFRTVIQPKHPKEDPDFIPKPYYQVYQQKNGFIPNLSILDLLFNMGNEAILYLIP